MIRSIVAILGSLVMLSGCYMQPPVPEERYQRAMQLVDDGTRYLRDRRFDDARRMFVTASELAPLASAVDGEGCVALLTGEFARAEELFTKAYEMDSSYNEALANLALLMDITGRKERSRMLYDRYLQEAPDSVIARNNRAVLEYDRGARKMLILDELQRAATISDHDVITGNIQTLSRLLNGDSSTERTGSFDFNDEVAN